MHRYILCCFLAFVTALAPPELSAQQIPAQKKADPLQIALTFDDLPAHGQKPPEVTRLQIVESILATLKQNRLPPVYGFMNGARHEEDSTSLEVLRAWRAAGESLGSHTWSHPALDEMSAAGFEADIAKNEPLLK